MEDLLSETVVAAIADQYRRAAQDAAHDFADQRADEDSLTGALGGALRRLVEGQAIDDRGVAVAWKTHLVKVRGRGRGAGEKLLGADAFLELVVLDAGQQPVRRKLLAVQAKKQWSKTDRRLASQVEAMQRTGQACLVVDYTPEGYFAVEGDAVLRAGGSARKLQPRERTTLGDALADRFLRCKIGTVGATYDVDRQRLLGTVPEADGLPAWAPLVASTIVGPAIVKRATSTRAVRDRPPIPGAGTGPEFTTVESPFIDQLVDMGWNFVTGNLDEPSATGRETFREVLIKSDLRKAIERINVRDGKPWLDDARVSQVVSALERIAAPKLMEANQQATELLLKGLAVEGLPDWDQGRSKTAHYIDWEHPENNTFTVMNQFRVDCPGGMAKGFIVPDLVLFVNGIPLVVVECKSPGVAEPLPSAVDQLRRYSNQRKAAGEIEDNEGNERLFHTNQFLVATSFDEARVSTIGADMQHYLEWKDTAPVPLGDVAEELGVGAPANLSSQQKLIAGMLRPENLLDIVRHFTLFQPVDGRMVKVVCRYQQFRAVQAAVNRLLTGKTREQDGEHDRRGGLVWHTQGSGKSLTMMFLVRKLRSLPALRRFKVVLVTDRKDLQDQLSDTAALTGETVKVAKSVDQVKHHLAEKGPALVFAMIQKYAERVAAASEDESDGPEIDPGTFPVLNDDESILVLVDEAHRSHSSALHGSLLNALPNCARIGFTGTPIIMGAKKRTHDIFGEFLDRYTLKESEADGATVPILYEGRTAEGAVADGRDMDQLFEDLFSDRPADELEAIKRKYATKGHVLEAPKLIEAKARDILRHYVENILPNGLKAQVVAYSRLAAIRYTAALAQARDELVAEAEALEPKLRDLDDAALESKPRKVRAAVRAWRSLPMLRQIEFATIISGGNNDDPAWKEWTESPKVKARIARFKKPLGEPTEKTDPLAFLAVKSMLLTGFDAPVEGVMYLDRPIREAELLQAIARVNRTGHGKKAGIVVDYYGVARHLKEALSAYAADDIDGALRSLGDELPKLRDQHHRVMDVFVSRGVDNLDDPEDAVQLLADVRLRAEFTVKLKKFLDTLDLVLPRPEGLPYVTDAKRLSFIYTRARNLYRDGMPTLVGWTSELCGLLEEGSGLVDVPPEMRVLAIAITSQPWPRPFAVALALGIDPFENQAEPLAVKEQRCGPVPALIHRPGCWRSSHVRRQQLLDLRFDELQHLCRPWNRGEGCCLLQRIELRGPRRAWVEQRERRHRGEPAIAFGEAQKRSNRLVELRVWRRLTAGLEHASFRLVAEHTCDRLRRNLPRREDQPLGEVRNLRVCAFQFPIRKARRNPEKPPRPDVERLPDDLARPRVTEGQGPIRLERVRGNERGSRCTNSGFHGLVVRQVLGEPSLDRVALIHEAERERRRLPDLHVITAIGRARDALQRGICLDIADIELDPIRKHLLHHAVAIDRDAQPLGPAHHAAQDALDGPLRSAQSLEGSVAIRERLAELAQRLLKNAETLVLAQQEADGPQEVRVVVLSVVSASRVHLVGRRRQQQDADAFLLGFLALVFEQCPREARDLIIGVEQVLEALELVEDQEVWLEAVQAFLCEHATQLADELPSSVIVPLPWNPRTLGKILELFAKLSLLRKGIYQGSDQRSIPILVLVEEIAQLATPPVSILDLTLK